MNKKIVKLSVIALVICSVVITITNKGINAHPGRTDSDGCHVCRTNCESYGLSYGEYHCHNGGGSNNNQEYNNNNNQDYNSNYNYEYEQQKKQEQFNLFQENAGDKDGYNYKINNPNATYPKLSNTNEYYNKAYQRSFEKAEKELEDKTIILANEQARNDASITESMNTQIPEGVIDEIYKEEYKESYLYYEDKYIEDVISEAKNNAKRDVYNMKNEDFKNDFTLNKAINIYSSTYKREYSDLSKEIKYVKGNIKEIAIKDANDHEEKDYSHFEDYTFYKIKGEFIKEYNKYFDQELDKINCYRMILISAGIVILLLVVFMLYRRYKRKKCSDI